MKKTYLSLFILAIGAAMFTACTDDDIIGGNENPDIPLAELSKPKANPWLAQEEYSITHFNSAQTDAFTAKVKDGTFYADLTKCKTTSSGPVNLMTLASTSPKYMWGMSSDRVSIIDVSNGNFERLAEAGLPGITMKTQEQLNILTSSYSSYSELATAVTGVLGAAPQMSMANGNYVLCDKDNYVYTNAGHIMARYKLKNPNNPKEGIELDSQIKLTPYINNSHTLVGATMTYDGHLIVAAQNALVVLNRELTTVEDLLAGFSFPIHFSMSGDNRKEPVFFCCTPECGWTMAYLHFNILPITSALSRFRYMAFVASVSFMLFSASI